MLVLTLGGQDCGVMEQCKELVRRAHEELGGLDVIVGNAVRPFSPISHFKVICTFGMRECGIQCKKPPQNAHICSLLKKTALPPSTFTSTTPFLVDG
jgi:hypothetical protein